MDSSSTLENRKHVLLFITQFPNMKAEKFQNKMAVVHMQVEACWIKVGGEDEIVVKARVKVVGLAEVDDDDNVRKELE